jgi:hypothetical protein
MFALSVALMVACAALLAYSALSGRRRLFRSVAFTGGVAGLFLITATIIGFSAN